MTKYDALFARQGVLVGEFQRISTNFGKDPAVRKTSEYLQKRIISLDNLWGEFGLNDKKLQSVEIKSLRYFMENIYERAKECNYDTRATLVKYEPYKKEIETVSGAGSSSDSSSGGISKLDDLLSRQRTKFRALKRLISSIEVSDLSEKWELEDELSSIQSRWKAIDQLRLEIDNILESQDVYQEEFLKMEVLFRKNKGAINQKLSDTFHIQQTTPKQEIPTFSGKYTQWPTFLMR